MADDVPVPTPAPTPAPADVTGAAMAAAEAAVKARMDADKLDAAKAAAEAERTRSSAELAAKATAAEARAAAAEAKVRDHAIAAALPALKSAEFLPILTEGLGEIVNGELSAEQVAKLAAKRAEHPYLFAEGAAPLGSTPGSSAGHRAAEGALDAEDTKALRMIGVPERGDAKHWSRSSAVKGFGEVVFSRVGAR